MSVRPLFVLLAAAAALPAAAADPQHILFYGNSFTNGPGGANAVPFLVRNIATAAGRTTPNVENAAVDGQTLGYHRTSNQAVIANPVDFAEAAGFQWDVVVMQGYSTETTHIGNVPQFRADAVGLFSNVKAHSPAVKPVLFETWARSPGHAYYPATFAAPAAMQSEVRASYDLARGDLDAALGTSGATKIAPVGDAFEDANWSNLYGPDLYHANNRGYLLAALTIYATVYGDDTADINLSPILSSLGLTASDGAALTSLADAAVPEPGVAGLLGVSAVTLLRRRRRDR